MTETLRDLAERQMQKQADARAENRRNFPECARITDLLNEAGLGPVRVIFAEENGRLVGRVP